MSISFSSLAKPAAGAVLIGSLALGLATPAQAVNFNAGTVTSSIYFSRAETKAIQSSNLVSGAAGLAKTACRLVGRIHPAGAVGCSAAVLGVRYTVGSAVSRAAASNGCLRIRIVGTPGAWLTSTVKPVPVGAYSDHSGYCRN